MIKVSVIVPIYNVSKYLNQCLTSLASQTMEHSIFQVILIDDGSTDSSGEIADCFINKYSNFEVYHTANQGVSLSRKLGVTKAKGEYIGFVDGDDYCDHDMFRNMYEKAEYNDLDIVACRNYSFTDKGVEESINTSLYDDKVARTYQEVFDSVIMNTIIDGSESVVLWNKLYKRKLFDDYEVDFGKNILEDYLVNMQCLKHTKRFMQISKPLYYYRVSANSLSRSFKTEIFDRLLEVQLKKEEIFREEFSKDAALVCRADHWFIKYVESIVKSLYLFSSSDLNRDEYMICVLSNPVVIKKAKEQVSAGSKSVFAKLVSKGYYKQLLVLLKTYSAIYKVLKQLKGN